MRNKRHKEFNRKRKEMLMHNVLAIDVAKGKSMVTLVSSSGEVLIDPYEISHTYNDFNLLLKRIKRFDNISVIMESTGIYHRPIERFLLENNFKVFVINPIYGKMKKRNLRKTKTDKEDCFNLVNLFLSSTFKEYIRPEQLYLDLNALSRQYFALDEVCVNIKNRYRNLIYLCFPEYEKIFNGNAIYSNVALDFMEKYPHADIIANTRIDALQNFFKKHDFKYWKAKPIKIKQYASNSYPAIDMNDELVSNLSQIARLVNEYQKAIDIVKYKIVFLAKKSKYFEPINSIFGIGEFTAAIIIAELGDINRFNNIKELTAYCGLDPSIKQSGKSINFKGPISKSGNKYMRKILYIAISNIIRLTASSKQENDIENYYRKKRNEGKHHYAAIVACTTKLLRKILALCKQLDK